MSQNEPISVNSWLEEELYQQYLHDRRAVDPSWKDIFEEVPPEPRNGHANGTTTPAPVAAVATTAPPPVAAPTPTNGEQLIPLRGASARLADNMSQSLSVPTATSQRIIPVKVIDENRRLINHHRGLRGQPKISYTHIVGWAIVRALESMPQMNHAYAHSDGQGFRVVPNHVNLGLAVDLAGRDGSRSLVVPSIKDAGRIDFQEFLSRYEDLVARARTNKLTPADFQGTTISLTNPGTVGTFGSVPRLMNGQGCIIATGAIDYPAEYQGVSPAMRATLGVGKVMSLGCTYDHRVIQGAESGMFLRKIHELLQGEHNFYEQIFRDLKLPYNPIRWEPDESIRIGGITESPGMGGVSMELAAKQAAVILLVNAYRVRGHLLADLDPLGSEPSYHPELDPATYGLSIWDLDRPFLTGTLGGATHKEQRTATLREILETLRSTYCGKVGIEFMHIQSPEEKRWLQKRMEPTANAWPIERTTQRRILEQLIEAEEFEHFLHSRFVGQKRFALEGAESAMSILDTILDRAANRGVHEAVIGMAHRGRLTVLANLVGKPLQQIFSAFEGEPDPNATQGSGDVKYHLGASGVRPSSQGREIKVSVSPNPSHLEAVDPVVEGIVRPKQDRLNDTRRERVIPVLVHGDAAFAGQGVVAETLNISQLEGYHTGGTLHLIINNQIGFTTPPEESRSTVYCTDVARTVQAPIFHVNGDDPDACARITEMAYDFRQTFKKDVVIDMICYRRHGHNEGDDPSYTQPILYRKIRQQPTVVSIYSEKLIREGVVTQAEVDQIRRRYVAKLSEAFDASKSGAEEFEVQELSTVEPEQILLEHTLTSVSESMVARVIQGVTTLPEDFHLHPKLRGFLDKRREVLNGAPVDWATAEAIAFGSMVLEGTPVRLSGQDSSRGTFSQRHLELYDVENGRLFVPLKHVSPDQARFDVLDSSLSEYAVMGFEFGYSVGDPLTLVMWEGQFGDFSNGAQIMIDQFIAAAESKWGQPSGLVLLLPHGYEGQGPEHSSARIERFLQLCAEDNIQVCNCTTPAQYFHLLRRQMYGGKDRRGVRKPLIVFTPKSMLRHPRAVSALPDLTNGRFHKVLGDTASINTDTISRILLSSGKVYWDLLAAREERKADHVALVRIEQLHPFPVAELQDILMRYPATAELVWVQEEPRNMGPWRFMAEKLDDLLEHRRLVRYAGRPESASPATGSHKRHQQEQASFIDDAFAAQPNPARKAVRVVRKRTRA